MLAPNSILRYDVTRARIAGPTNTMTPFPRTIAASRCRAPALALALALAVSLTLAGTASAATQQHEVLTFDYGWRFKLNKTAPPPPPVPQACRNLPAVFPLNESAYTLKGQSITHFE